MLPEPVAGLEQPRSGALVDRYGRAHTYLRVSVTDRCNYRCTYCMPAQGLDWIPRQGLLTFEEIARVVRVLVRGGVERVRLTGGEPTVRRGIEQLVAMLADNEGLVDLSMTTNGHLFADKADALAKAGLKRINVSIDTLDPERFRAITRGGDLERVLRAIEAARDAGLTPIKLNMVVIGGETDDEVPRFVERFTPHAADTIVRFIEFMPFDAVGLARKHVPAAQIRERVSREFGLTPLEADLGAGPAKYWQTGDGLRLGFISPITEHFCQACNRLRLQADGHLRTCLSREAAPSLRDLLRAGMTDAQLEAELRDRLWAKVAGHEAHLDGGRAFEGAMTSVGG